MKLMKSEPYAYQRVGSKLALGNDAFALWMEQGTGKTWTALKVTAVRWRRDSVRLVLIVGPKNVIGSWGRQIKQHLNVPADVFMGKDGITKVCSELRSFDRLTFLVINYELLWRRLRLLKGMSWDMMIADEAHRTRNRTSRQSKAAWKLGEQIRYKLALTGTPVGEDERDLFAQFRWLTPEVFGDTWKPFEKRYVRKIKIYKNDGGHWFKIRMKPGAREKITKKVAPYVYRITADKALDLPPATDKAIYFPLTGRARTAYEKLERDFVYEFGDFKATTPLAITKLLRLSQLTGGYLGLDDKETLLKLEQDKLAQFEDWFSDLPRDEKLVIFARHTHEIDALSALMKRHKRTFAVRDGRTKKKNLNDWMAFQDKPHPQVYIAQIASGGIGIDLFAARYCVFYSNSFSWIDYDQARKRLLRNGQRRKVLFLHMIAENTIDEDLYKALDEKRLTADAILRRIQRRRKRITTMAKKPAAAKTEEAPAPKTEEAPAAEKTKRAPPPRVSPDFGVPKLAEKLGLTGAEVRVLLRAGDYAEKYKTEAGWDFGDQKTIDKIADELTKADAARKKAKAEKAAAEEKSAPKEEEEKSAPKAADKKKKAK